MDRVLVGVLLGVLGIEGGNLLAGDSSHSTTFEGLSRLSPKLCALVNILLELVARFSVGDTQDSEGILCEGEKRLERSLGDILASELLLVCRFNEGGGVDGADRLGDNVEDTAWTLSSTVPYFVLISDPVRASSASSRACVAELTNSAFFPFLVSRPLFCPLTIAAELMEPGVCRNFADLGVGEGDKEFSRGLLCFDMPINLSSDTPSPSLSVVDSFALSSSSACLFLAIAWDLTE